MAARTIPYDTLTAEPEAADPARARLQEPDEPPFEVVGHLVAAPPAELRVVPERDDTGETEALRIAELEAALDTWRRRAFAEAAARRADAAAAYERQRELVSALHRQLIENDQLHAALAWHRRPWWRRAFRTPAVPGPAVA